MPKCVSSVTPLRKQCIVQTSADWIATAAVPDEDTVQDNKVHGLKALPDQASLTRASSAFNVLAYDQISERHQLLKWVDREGIRCREALSWVFSRSYGGFIFITTQLRAGPCYETDTGKMGLIHLPLHAAACYFLRPIVRRF